MSIESSKTSRSPEVSRQVVTNRPQGAPGRARPFEKTNQPTPPWLRAILGRDIAPTRAEYDRACAAAWEGDPAMDALITWMFEVGPKRGRALFEQALEHGIASVPDAPEPLRTFFATVERTPSWVDEELIEEGVRFCHRAGTTTAFVLRDLALMGGYMLSGFNQSLVMTGALNKGTAQRIAETGKWWIDCTEPNGLRRYGPGFKTTMHVRLVHGLVRRHLANKPEWDHAHWGLPLSQIDMVATYLGFSVVMLGGLRKMGIPITLRESRGVMQLWGYACWLMGVDETWIRLRESEGIVLLQHTMMTQSRPDWTSRELGMALADEPMHRSYEHFETARRKLAYHQHLSVSRYFLGPDKMRELGLPEGVSPWYPMLTFGPRFATYTGQRVLPGLRERQIRRGRAAQRAMLTSMFGDKDQRVIDPAAGHPAHV